MEAEPIVHYKCTTCSEYFMGEEAFFEHARTHHCKILISEGYGPEVNLKVFASSESSTACTNLLQADKRPEDSVGYYVVLDPNSEEQLSTGADRPTPASNLDSGYHAREYSGLLPPLATFPSRCDDKEDANILSQLCNETLRQQFDGLTYQSTTTDLEFSAQVELSTTDTAQANGSLKSKSKKRAYYCGKCNKKFWQASVLMKHATVHTDHPFTCELCDNVFIDSVTLNEHVAKTHLAPKLHECDLCSKRFTMKSNLKRHRKAHTDGKTYACETCLKSFARASDLNRHIHIHTGMKPYTCEICGKQFRSADLLMKHKRRHLGEKPFPCEVCNKKFSRLSLLSIHKRIHNSKRIYKCEICKRQFKSLIFFNKHKKRVHSNTKGVLACEVCDKKFTVISNLKRHESTHSGEKPYKCDLCDKRFTRIYDVKRHKPVHTGEKPYKCNLCEKRFSTTSNLAKHARNHSCRTRSKKILKESTELVSIKVCPDDKLCETEEVANKCKARKKQPTCSNSVESHKIHCAELKSFKCDVCDKMFSLSGNLRRHKKLHDGIKPHKCNICSKHFSRLSDLKRHLAIHS